MAALALLAAFAASAASTNQLTSSSPQPQQDDTIVSKAPKSRFGGTAVTDPSLLGRTDSALVQVLVKLAYHPIANYEGDIPGLAATSPQKTGKKLRDNKAAVDAYTRHVITYESKALDRIRTKIPAAKVRQSFRTIYGGVALTLPANNIDDLLAIDGVVAVQADSLEQPTTVR